MTVKSSKTYKTINVGTSQSNGMFSPQFNFNFVLNRSINGSSLPDYYARIQRGENATTAMEASEELLDYHPGVWRGKMWDNDVPPNYNSIVTTYCGLEPKMPVQFARPDLVTRAQADCRSKAYKKLSELQNSFNGQVILGEMGQTVRMLKNPLEGCVKLTQHFLKEKSLRKDIASLWLQYRFGILPLLSDMKSIMALITEGQKTKNLSYRFYAKAETSDHVVQNSGDFTSNSWQQEYDTVYTAECVIHLGIRADLLNPSQPLAAARLINTIDDWSSIPSTAWELIPFSFLIDYFVNVGDLIQAVTTGNALLSYTSESVITTVKLRGTSNLVDHQPDNWLEERYVPPSFESKRRTVSRAAGQLAIPPIVFELPGSNVRYLNIAALATLLLT